MPKFAQMDRDSIGSLIRFTDTSRNVAIGTLVAVVAHPDQQTASVYLQGVEKALVVSLDEEFSTGKPGHGDLQALGE